MGGREDVEATWVPSGGVRKPWRSECGQQLLVLHCTFAPWRPVPPRLAGVSRGPNEEPRRPAGGLRLALPGTCGAVKRTNTRGGARPSTPTPQGPGPRHSRPRAPALPRRPRPRRRGGEAGRLPESAHSLTCSLSIARRRRRARPAAAAGIREQAKRPLIRTSPPNGTAAGQADGVRTVRTAAARACSPTAGARETRAPLARWALHPNTAFALGSHLPWAAPAEGRARQTPWLGAEGLLPGPTLAQGLAGGFGETAGDLQGASALLCPRDLTPATRGQPALRASRPPSQGPSRALLSQREDPARPEQSE